MKVLHAYHAYVDGAWLEPVAEHLAALEDAKFDGEFMLGLVGSLENRCLALDAIGGVRFIDHCVRADNGFEQVTLTAARAWAHKNDGAVMYAHTKGAGTPNKFQGEWRRSMTYHVISNWRMNLERLQRYDAVGCHWLTEEEFPDIKADTPYPMFGGNFWMATTDYLRTLPPVRRTSRHDAEAWIGLGDPKVHDMTPGWPGSQPFYRPRIRRLIAGPAGSQL